MITCTVNAMWCIPCGVITDVKSRAFPGNRVNFFGPLVIVLTRFYGIYDRHDLITMNCHLNISINDQIYVD